MEKNGKLKKKAKKIGKRRKQKEGLSSAEKNRQKQKRKEKKEQESKILKQKLIKAKQLSAQQILITKELNKTLREIDRMCTKL